MDKDFLEKIVNILSNTYYGDVRLDKGYGIGIGKNKSRESINTSSSCGLCVRVLSDNKWHYLGFDNLEKEKILDQVKKLVEKAGNKKSKIILQDGWKIDKEIQVKKDPNNVSLEEKTQTIREIFKKVMENDKIINASSSISHSKSETLFMNTEGSVLRQVLPFFKFSIAATAREGKRIEQDYFVLAKQGGYELFENINIGQKINKVIAGATDMLKAEKIKGGRHDIIIDPEISGVVAHESFGHGLEADQALRDRSYLEKLKNKKIISDLVSIHDNGTLQGERGFFFFDDEGVKSNDTTLVKDGVLVKFMHDRQSAAFMDSTVTGNARAQDFSRKVFVRMTNTYIEPKDWKHDELLEETKSGFYLIRCLTGMEDPLGGNLQLMTHKAKKIENGELKGLYQGVGISGKVLEFLNNADAVTDDFEIRGSGCGKGHEDYVSVSSGGPFMRIKNAIIG